MTKAQTFWFCGYFRGLLRPLSLSCQLSVGTLLSRKRGVLCSRLMDNRHISLCQCHLSARLKMACEIKACLTGSAINATLDSHTAASASLFALGTSPLSPLFLTYFSLFLTPLGDMPCVSSAVQRKPKTRKILLKGVSQQPDINILLVCRAESKPLGICGFTWVCLCVPE